MHDGFEVLKVRPSWIKEAVKTATKRRNYHSKRGSKRHWHDPSKGEYTDEIYGSLAQIIFREKMKSDGFESICQFSPLYSESLDEMPTWDALVEGKTIDIKATPPDSAGIKRVRMLVKVREFKKLDFYVAIKFWSKREYSICGFATGEEVASTPRVNFGYALAHWFFLDKLPHTLKDKWWKVNERSKRKVKRTNHSHNLRKPKRTI